MNLSTTPINTLLFPKQAYLFALLSNYAYSEEKEGTPKFNELGFDATFFDTEGREAYVLMNTNDLVLVCRGTEPSEFSDIKADLEVAWVGSSTGKGRVHLGFNKSADQLWKPVKEILSKHGKTRTVWFAGHSLGAAIATILAYKCQRTENMPNPHALFTYGSPRIGNKDYIAGIKFSGVAHYRFVNCADIVARVPPHPFHHYGGMYYMNHWGNVRIETYAQVFQDRVRGLIKGIKQGQINYFLHHSIERYCEALLRYSNGEEAPQDTI